MVGTARLGRASVPFASITFLEHGVLRVSHRGRNFPNVRCATKKRENEVEEPSAARQKLVNMNIMPILCTGSVAYTLHAMPSVPNA